MELWVLVSQRQAHSWKCPSDWLQVQQEPWLLSGASGRVKCQSCLHAHAMSSQQWIKGLMKTPRAWTPSVVLCDGRVKQGLCSTA